jgi:hypothetical protein
VNVIRLEHLEKAFVEGDGELFNSVAELKAEMATLTEKLEVRLLIWACTKEIILCWYCTYYRV